MEDGLLLTERSKEERIGWEMMRDELKKLGYLAGPMVAVTLSQYLLQIISVMMVGHLGELSVSSTAIAVSLAGVTGWSVIMGMAGGLETLSGQAYGAQQYHKLGTQTYTAIFSLIITCIPISILWIYMGQLLKYVGQDPLISNEAGKFIVWLVPALFGYAFLQPLTRFYQMQSLILPMFATSCLIICFHAILCWVLVFRSELQNIGAAVAIDISMWLNVAILAFYMKYSPSCAETRAPLSMKILDGVKEFFCYAIPSTLMVCLEWWSFELLILLSGILPNPQLETSVLSVCLNVMGTLNAIPYGLSAAASTRISNNLGAGEPHGARLSAIAVITLAAVIATIISSTIFASREVFGYIFSNEKEVVDYVKVMTPFVCLSVIIDNIQVNLQGVARGCGWQHIGAYINLAAFYLFGIPIAAVLAFWLDFRGKGLWIGILSGATLQMVLLSIATGCTNWGKKAVEARERLPDEQSPVERGLL